MQKKEIIMDVKDYCANVNSELSAWKAKLKNVSEKADALTGADRENAAPIVKDLKAIMGDIDERIAVLAHECDSMSR